MKEGDKLRERYTDLICEVLQVFGTHIIVQFEGSGLRYMVAERNYGKYEVINGRD